MDTGFRLFRKELVPEILPTIRHLGFFTAEFVIRSHDAGHRIIEIPVTHFRRQLFSSTIFRIEKLPYIISRELIGIAKLFFEIRLKK